MLQEHITVLLWVSNRQSNVRHPGRRCSQSPLWQVIGSKHIDSSLPHIRKPRSQSQSHEATIGSSHNSSPFGIDPRILLHMFQAFEMVPDVVPTPIPINELHVSHTITGASTDVRDEDRESVQRQVLDQRHREPGEIRSLLPLRPAMNILNKWARTLVSKLGRWKIESSRDPQSVPSSITRIFPRGKIVRGNTQHFLV